MEPWFARPLSEVVSSVSVALIDGQIEVEESSVERKKAIERAYEAGDLDHDLEVPWYRFSEIETELDLELAIAGREIRDENGDVRAYEPVVTASPSGSRATAGTGSQPDRASTLRTNLVPVKPQWNEAGREQ